MNDDVKASVPSFSRDRPLTIAVVVICRPITITPSTHCGARRSPHRAHGGRLSTKRHQSRERRFSGLEKSERAFLTRIPKMLCTVLYIQLIVRVWLRSRFRSCLCPYPRTNQQITVSYIAAEARDLARWLVVKRTARVLPYATVPEPWLGALRRDNHTAQTLAGALGTRHVDQGLL